MSDIEVIALTTQQFESMKSQIKKLTKQQLKALRSEINSELEVNELIAIKDEEMTLIASLFS